MRHRTFEDIYGSVGLCLAGDRDSEWIIDHLQRRAVLFARDTATEDIHLQRMPDPTPEEPIVMVLLPSSEEEQELCSLVFTSQIDTPRNGIMPAIFVVDRECEPFWFGLKTTFEVLVSERALRYGHMKMEIAHAIAALVPGAPENRDEQRKFRRESHELLRNYANETKAMYTQLVFGALNRRLDGALVKLVPAFHERRAEFYQPRRTPHDRDALLREQRKFLQAVAHDLLRLTRHAFPEPSSLEEEVVRSSMLAVASSHVVDQVLRPLAEEMH